MRANARVAATAVLLMLPACGSDPVPPSGPQPVTGPGFLRLAYTTPNTDDGAVFFTLGGAPFDSLTTPFTLLAAESGPNEQRVVIAGNFRGNAVGIFWVPERSNISLYTVTLHQVATEQTYVQRDLQGYSMAIVP